MSEATNVYQAPEADITPETTPTELSLQPARNCGVGAGWRWFAQGYTLFTNGVGPSIGMILTYLVIMFVLGMVPLVNIVSYFLGPIFMAGFMVAAHRSATEEQIQFSDLFAGFKKNVGSLLLVTLLYLVAMMLAFAVIGILAAILGGGDLLSALGSGNADPELLAPAMALLALLAVAFMIPVAMAIWFAPALIIFNDAGPFTAMKLSFAGCLKNILPFLIYGILALIAFFVSAIPLGLGLLITLPALFYSTYAAYRDIFIDREL